MRNRVTAIRPATGEIEDSPAKRRPAPEVGNMAMARLLGDGGAAPGPASAVVQPKLAVGPVGDRYEQEADRVADTVTSPQAPNAQREGSVEEDELQMSPVQRQDDEDELQMTPVQRQDDEDELQMTPLRRQDEEGTTIGAAGGALDASTESAVVAASAGGRPLTTPVRREMESSFGADFSSVRVHTGPAIDDLNSSLQSRAFTTGSDVFVRSGDYAPGSPEGKRLLAHELTHVVQQGAAKSVEEG